MAKLKTLYNSILIKIDEQEEVHSPGGIIITDPDKHNTVLTGTVKVVGSGYRTEHGIVSLEVEVGNRVIVPKNTGFEIEVDGEKYLSVPEDVVLAIILED